MIAVIPDSLRRLRNCRLAALLGGSLWAMGFLADLPAQAHMRGMYATKAEAEKRAAELKCNGTFAMGNMWMPCANERALHEALQRAQ